MLAAAARSMIASSPARLEYAKRVIHTPRSSPAGAGGASTPASVAGASVAGSPGGDPHATSAENTTTAMPPERREGNRMAIAAERCTSLASREPRTSAVLRRHRRWAQPAGCNSVVVLGAQVGDQLVT